MLTTARTPNSDDYASAVNGTNSSISQRQPPLQWREHWHGHNRTLTLAAIDDEAAVYFDESVHARAGSILSFVSRAWRYAKSTYGNAFGPDDRLYAVFHQGRYGGGHPATYFDASHDHRNTIDCGSGHWDAGRPGVFDIPAHEISHVVEGANNGVHESPAFTVWGDSKWAEFFIYDLYVALGMHRDAARVRADFLRCSDSFPFPGTHWFRDWFGPLWSEAHGPDVMVEFFKLLAEQFPRSTDGRSYSRRMSLGEYIHFTSGAIGRDLSYQARIAFGQRDSWNRELAAARREFPDIDYRSRGAGDAVGPVTTGRVDRRPSSAISSTAESGGSVQAKPSRVISLGSGLVAGRAAAATLVQPAQPGHPARPGRPASLYDRIQLTSALPNLAPPLMGDGGGERAGSGL